MSNIGLDKSVVDIVRRVPGPKRSTLVLTVGTMLCVSGFFVFIAVAGDLFGLADRVGALMLGSAMFLMALGGACVFCPKLFPPMLRPWRCVAASNSVSVYLEKWASLLLLAAPLTLVGLYPWITLAIPGSEFFRSYRLIGGLALSVILIGFSVALVLSRSRVRFTRGSMQIYGRSLGSSFRTDISAVESMSIIVRDGIHLDLVVTGEIDVVRKPRFQRRKPTSPRFVRIHPLADDMDMITQLTLIQRCVGVPIRVA